MAGLLDSLGQGLQAAGGILSPEAFDQGQKERAETIKNLRMLQQQVMEAVQNGTAPPEALQKVGIAPGLVQPSAQSQLAKQQMDMNQQFLQSLGQGQQGQTGQMSPQALMSPMGQEWLKTQATLKSLNKPTEHVVGGNLVIRDPQGGVTITPIGEGSTPFEKEAEAAYGKNSPEYFRAIKQHLAKMDAPPQTILQMGMAQQAATTDPIVGLKKFGFSEDGAKYAAIDKIINGKYPTGGAMGGQGMIRNAMIDNLAVQMGQQAGLDLTQLATMPAEKKAQASALMKQVVKQGALAGTFASFENNLDTWDQIAKGIPPTMAGKLSQQAAAAFQKIQFTESMTVNDIRNAVAKQFNDPATVAYLTSTMAVAMDYSRIMSSQGQSAGRVTDSAMHEAMRMIPAGTNDKARGALKATLIADGQGQLKGIDSSVDTLRKGLTSFGVPKEEKTTSKIPAGGKLVGNTPDGKPVYQTPDGKKWVE